MSVPVKVEDAIKEIHIAVYGNGDIKHGLVWKVENNTEFINMLKSYFKVLVTICITGSLSAIGMLILTVVRLANGKIN